MILALVVGVLLDAVPAPNAYVQYPSRPARRRRRPWSGYGPRRLWAGVRPWRPMGGGIGSGIAGGLASGLAAGAGIVAGEELAHHFLDGGQRTGAA